jgi:hypothetical protein
MANTDKDILITPNNGSSSADPKIEFKGADASTSAQTITATAYPTNNGTLSFDGSAGQLFSITNDMTGTIFSVNDVSGIPSIEVDDDGTIRFAEYSGNVLIGTATDDGTGKLQVNGSITVDDIYMSNALFHEGDTDTHLSFGTDLLALTTGGTARVYVSNSGVQLGDTGNGYFQPVSGQYGSIQIDGGAHGGWEGYSIGGRAVLMHDNNTVTGLYNDVDNEWLIYCVHNSYTNLYYNGSYRLQTTSTGIDIPGDLNAVDNIYVASTIYHEGDTDTYLQFADNTMYMVTAGSNNMSFASSWIDSNVPIFNYSVYYEDYDALSGTSVTVNTDTAQGFSLTMTGNTTFTFNSVSSPWSYGFILELTGNGSTVTWPSSVDWTGGTAPDAPASGETDIYVFWTRDGGTTWYGVQSIDAAA